MHKFTLLRHIIIKFGPPACFAFLCACVSVKLPSTNSARATEYDFEEPKSPFKKLKTENADHAWQSELTGNTIAVLTECNSRSNRSLQSLESESINAVNNPKIMETVSIDFNERQALQSTVEGSVDGVPVRLYILSFQKNSCNFTLTLMGRSSSTSKETSAFENFKREFRVK